MIEFTSTGNYPEQPGGINSLEAFVGYIPSFLSEADPRPAKEQIRENYIGGWHEFRGFELRSDNSIKYPGDPELRPAAIAQLRDETIIVYPHGWTLILQPDGSHEIARLD